MLRMESCLHDRPGVAVSLLESIEQFPVVLDFFFIA